MVSAYNNKEFHAYLQPKVSLHTGKVVGAKEQCNNRGSNINITIGNATKSLMCWCEIFNVDYKKVYARYKRNGYEGIDRLFNDIL